MTLIDFRRSFECNFVLFGSLLLLVLVRDLLAIAEFLVCAWSEALSSDTIRYDSVYLTCSKKLTGSQLSPLHITSSIQCLALIS